MSIARFENIPVPPSTNRLWSRTKTGMRISDAYKRWKNEAGWLLRIARQPKIKGAYLLDLKLQRGSTGIDLGNAEKAASDLLQAIGVIENDALAERITLAWSDTAKLMEIEVRAAPCLA